MLRWVCDFTLNLRQRNPESSELLGLVSVSLVIKNGRLGSFGHMQCKDDSSWAEFCTTMKVNRRWQTESEADWVIWRRMWKFGSDLRGCTVYQRKSKGWLANPGSSGKIAVKMMNVDVCYIAATNIWSCKI